MLLPPPQICDAEHTEQVAPPLPQLAFVLPDTHCPEAEQHPPHVVLSHVQVPLTQCVPLPQVPAMHVPPQPSLAPQAFAEQFGTQAHALLVQAQPV